MCRDMKLTCMSQPVTMSASTAVGRHCLHTTSSAFRLGTVGGAEALNLSDVIGTVEEGKKVELAIFDVLSRRTRGSKSCGGNITSCTVVRRGVLNAQARHGCRSRQGMESI